MQIILDIILFLIYLSLFILLIVYSWRFFLAYVQQKHLDSLDWILLEFKLPTEIYKSPRATELALASLIQTGGVGTWYHRNIKGILPVFFSLEIASLEGDVRFFIRTQKKFKSLISNNFYSQYPDIEIIEAEDYINKIFYDHRSKETNLFAAEYKLSNKLKIEDGNKKIEIPGDYLPIKTYVDFGIDKDPKEEFKIDPITPIIEWLGSLKKGEFASYQIILQPEANFDNKKFPATYINPDTHEHLKLEDVAKLRVKQIKEIKIAPKYKKGDKVYDEYGYVKKRREGDQEVELVYNKDDEEKIEKRKASDLFDEEKEELKAIGKKLSKPLFRTLIRINYITHKDSFNGGSVQSVLSVLKHFNEPGYNNFTMSVSDPYAYDWQDTFKKRRPWRKEEFFEAMVEREAFYIHLEKRKIDDWFDILLFNNSYGFRKKIRLLWENIFHPFDHPHAEVSIMNLEEIATLWHLPGKIASTPGLKRIDSIKSEAPINLPT